MRRVLSAGDDVVLYILTFIFFNSKDDSKILLNKTDVFSSLNYIFFQTKTKVAKPNLLYWKNPEILCEAGGPERRGVVKAISYSPQLKGWV